MSGPGYSTDFQNDSVNNQMVPAGSYLAEDTDSANESISSLPAPSYSLGSEETENTDPTIGDVHNTDYDLGSINEGSNDVLPVNSNEENSSEEKEGTEWSVPFDLDTVCTASDVKKYIWRLMINANQVRNVIKDSKDIPGDLAKMDIDTEALGGMYAIIRDNYEGEEEVESSDIENLQKLSNKWEESYGENFNNVKNESTSSLTKLKDFKKINTQSPELKEALQSAFYDTDSSLVKKITDIVDTANQYNETGSKLVGLAQDNLSYVKGSVLMDMMKDGGDRMGKLIGKAKDTLDIAQDLETLYDNAGGTGKNLGGAADSLGAIMNSVDKVVNFVDLPGINILQGLWNHVYKPMIDVCVTGIGKIESMLGKGRRDAVSVRIQYWKENQIGKDNTAPTFVKGMLDTHFEGGWQVFNFMWNVMCREWDRIPNDTVVSYFEDNYDRINAGVGQKSEIPYHYKGLSWYIDSTELMFWALDNKHKLWAMFYGTNLPIPPGTK